jgi:hypothetical protein
MKTEDVVKYYGSKTNVAKALECWHTTISSWGKYPPIGRQYELQALTGGALKVTPKKAQIDDDVQRPKAS